MLQYTQGGHVMKQLDISSVYELLIEKIDTGLCAIDEFGRVIVYNKKMQELTGETQEQIQQRFLSQSLDFQLQENMLQKTLTSGQRRIFGSRISGKICFQNMLKS